MTRWSRRGMITSVICVLFVAACVVSTVIRVGGGGSHFQFSVHGMALLLWQGPGQEHHPGGLWVRFDPSRVELMPLIHRWPSALSNEEVAFNMFFLLPLWPVVILCAVLILVMMTRGRSRKGRCQACGYDLRGIVTGRCPECGVPMETRTGERHGSVC